MQDKEFASILQDEPMQPLALEPLTEEEQVSLSHTHTLVPTQLAFCTFLCSLLPEELLHVCEQRGSDEAHG